jgi:hypothetical protein
MITLQDSSQEPKIKRMKLKDSGDKATLACLHCHIGRDQEEMWKDWANNQVEINTLFMAAAANACRKPLTEYHDAEYLSDWGKNAIATRLQQPNITKELVNQRLPQLEKMILITLLRYMNICKI